MHPKHIDPNCPECGTALVLSDPLDNPDIDPKDIWPDEWACPKCYDGDGIYIDFEPEEKAELDRRIKEADEHPEKLIPWEEVRNKLYKKLGLTEEEIEERERKAKEEVDKMIEEGDLPKDRRILNFD